MSNRPVPTPNAGRQHPDDGCADDVFPGPVILIEIDPTVPGGHLAGRFDMTIRGRAISTAAISQIRLQTGDRMISASAYGQPGRAVLCEMADGTPGRQRMFRFNLPGSAEGRSKPCGFQIVARTEDGFEHFESFEVEADPSARVPVRVRSGPTSIEASCAPPDVVLLIERAMIEGDDTLTVAGWAVSFAAIQAIQVLVDGAFVSEAVYGNERQDIWAAFPVYPNALLSGFGLTIRLGEAHRHAATVRVRVVCANGFGHEESIPLQRGAAPEPLGVIDQLPLLGSVESGGGSLPEQVALSMPGSPQRQIAAGIDMYCDDAELTGDGLLSLRGWAVCQSGIVQVRVVLDGLDVGLGTFGHERLDVAGFHPECRMAHLSGFRFEQRVGDRFEGEHEVCIVVRDSQGWRNPATGCGRGDLAGGTGRGHQPRTGRGIPVPAGRADRVQRGDARAGQWPLDG